MPYRAGGPKGGGSAPRVTLDALAQSLLEGSSRGIAGKKLDHSEPSQHSIVLREYSSMYETLLTCRS